ncbi:hypothetical protein BBJ28_00002450 [Nothophytophthora sp. Chile5]|nr:hypothetical protein BBJ28_00002450 [Nothophytophthora sp. Chile5]
MRGYVLGRGTPRGYACASHPLPSPAPSMASQVGKVDAMKTWEGDEDANLEECKLLSGEFAVLLQVLLGFIALSVLVFKRLREVPRRPLVWAFDASKQMVGASFAHVANLLIAILLYSYEDSHKSADTTVDQVAPELISPCCPAFAVVSRLNLFVCMATRMYWAYFQCALYFVNFTLDTTLGVFLNYVLLSAVSLLALRCRWAALTTPGDYGSPVRVSVWLAQLGSWIVVIFSTKLVIAVLIVALESPLGSFAVWLFKPLQNSPDVELALVMIACPCLMNALQFWIQDSFLKKDIRDESFLVAQTALSPASSVGGDSKLGTPTTDDESGDVSDGDAKLTVVTDGDAEVADSTPRKVKLKLDLSLT